MVGDWGMGWIEGQAGLDDGVRKGRKTDGSRKSRRGHLAQSAKQGGSKGREAIQGRRKISEKLSSSLGPVGCAGVGGRWVVAGPSGEVGGVALLWRSCGAWTARTYLSSPKSWSCFRDFTELVQASCQYVGHYDRSPTVHRQYTTTIDMSFTDILLVGGSGMKRSNYASGTAASMSWNYKRLPPRP
jgi:hypothetical protein